MSVGQKIEKKKNDKGRRELRKFEMRKKNKERKKEKNKCSYSIKILILH